MCASLCVSTCLDACASSEGAVWRGKYVPPRAGWSHLSAPFPRLSSGLRRLHPPGVSIPQGHTSTCVDGPPWWPSPVLRGRGLSPAPLSGQWLATPQALSACAFPAGGPGGAQLHPGRASDTGLDGGRAWPGAAGAPHAVCAWGSPSRGRAFPPPVCGLLNSWGSERRRGRGSDPPSPQELRKCYQLRASRGQGI